jgi:predicted ATP-grasp superfamily ATP-dependent carboligase
VSGRYQLGIRWLDEFRDPRSAWKHMRSGRLTLGQWFGSLTRVRVGALFASDDPLPFVSSVVGQTGGLRRRVTRRYEAWRQHARRLRRKAFRHVRLALDTGSLAPKLNVSVLENAHGE